ncbi:MAG TPA: mycothiol conjugate amidase Mca [Candidatus Nanopelagicaceae bacterium]|nr:mycothiol conjugate amidase Mca [Candidatus Nanopelagicaceae bacterium]
MSTQEAQSLRLMAVHAHPDDESSKGAATLAHYAAAGVQVLVVTCTGGERGDVINPAMKDLPGIMERIPEIRNEEMLRAAEILGIGHRWLGFMDSGFPQPDDQTGIVPPVPEDSFAALPLAVTGEALVKIVRDFKPHVMTTYDELGGYPHPDHIRTHDVALHAFETSGDPDTYPDAGAPWQPLKLYYNQQFSLERMTALDRAMTAAGLVSPYGERIAEFKESRPTRLTTRVHCAEFFGHRERALRAHATQVDFDGPWFVCPLAIQQQAWPTEEFELARSKVGSVDAVENDLFAGI